MASYFAAFIKIKIDYNHFHFIDTLVLSPCTIYLTNADPNTAYFFTQGRFFELGIGATLAVFWHSIPLAKMVNNILSTLLLILIPAVF
jgi:hypothetical protein